MSTVFISDIQELKQYETAKALLSEKKVPYKEKTLYGNVRVIIIANKDAGMLTRGVHNGKRGSDNFYYLPNGRVVLIQNGYGFSGRGMPHSRSTYAKVYTINNERDADAEKLFDPDLKNNSFKHKTVSEMEKILPDLITEPKDSDQPNMSVAQKAIAAKNLLFELNNRKLTIKQISSKTHELTEILDELQLDTEDLDATSVKLELIIIGDEAIFTGKRKELLERHIKYGEYGTGELCKKILADELKRTPEDFYLNIEQKIEHYTRMEENSNSDEEASKYADYCALYVSVLYILNSEKL